MDKMRFDPAEINHVFIEIEDLKNRFDEVETATSLINKRENLLGVEKTEFTELKVIQDDLKPLFELWIVPEKGLLYNDAPQPR